MEIKIYPKSTTPRLDYSEHALLNTIYRPSGWTKEYADFALNIYDGCNFSCSYCRAPKMLRMTKYGFCYKSNPKKNLLKRVDLDCRNLVNTGFSKKVLLCLACDPYQDVDVELKMTREVIVLFKKYGINFEVITKAGSRAMRDFDLYNQGDIFGTKMTFIDPVKSQREEPYAALPEDRIMTLKTAYDMGIPTWVSLEPVFDPEETLKLIDSTYKFVNVYKIGPTCYDICDPKIDWADFMKRLIDKLNWYGKEYCLRQDMVSLVENKKLG